MKTHAIDWPINWLAEHKTSAALKLDAASARDKLILSLAALLPASFVIVITLWAISMGALGFVSATFWTGGFIFLAFAVDNDNGRGTVLAGSGLTLLALAWLSSFVAPEFGVLAGVLASAWVTVPVINRLKLPTADSK
jgi:hypothetical protein